MGQAKFNPMSPQFKGKYPDEVEFAALRAVRHPTPEWHADHPTWQADGEVPPDEHTLVSIMVVTRRIEPSALFPGDPSKWPSSADVPLGPVLFMQPNARGEYEAIPAIMRLAKYRELTPIGHGRAADKEPPVMLEDEVTMPPAEGDGA